MPQVKRKILAVASAGGHWEQLCLIGEAFSGHDILFVTTLAGLRERGGGAQPKVVPDCNANEPFAILRCIVAVLGIMTRYRPEIVISTGALPGLVAIAIGRMFGARTLWIDSVANAEELSISGRYALKIAHRHFSQWEHVALAQNTEYAGCIL